MININDTAAIIAQMKADLNSGKVRIEARDTHRVYTDGVHDVMLGDVKTTAITYYNTFINPVASKAKTGSAFDNLPRCSIYVGPPDTGKTYSAQKFCKDNNVPYILIMGREDLTLETMLQDFTLEDGKPVYKNSLALNYLSGNDDCVIILDEMNTLRTGVLKTLQPLLDTTSTSFEFKGTVYNKNMNCKFICTLNDKDKGISILPDAILSRSKFKYFDKPDVNVLMQWTGYSNQFITLMLDMFEVLDIMPVFGTRQLKMIHDCADVNEITNHFTGLLALRNKDVKLLKTPEVQSKLGVVVNYV